MSRFSVSVIVRKPSGNLHHELATWRAHTADQAEGLAIADALKHGELLSLQVLVPQQR